MGGGDLGSKLTLICRHVFQGDREIKLIVHHADDMWQITCGDDNHEDENDFEVGHAMHLFEHHPTIENVMESLRPGFLAELKDGMWDISAHDD